MKLRNVIDGVLCVDKTYYAMVPTGRPDGLLQSFGVVRQPSIVQSIHGPLPDLPNSHFLLQGRVLHHSPQGARSTAIGDFVSLGRPLTEMS